MRNWLAGILAVVVLSGCARRTADCPRCSETTFRRGVLETRCKCPRCIVAEDNVLLSGVLKYRCRGCDRCPTCDSFNQVRGLGR